MGKNITLFLLFFLTGLFSKDVFSIIKNPSNLMTAALDFYKTSEECLYDVRDRNLKYESSSNCKLLGKKHISYLDAGGMKEEESHLSRIKAEEGKKTAWMAKAISCGGNSSIW